MNIIRHVVTMEVKSRGIECELGIITRADGSAQVKQGNTIGEGFAFM